MKVTVNDIFSNPTGWMTPRRTFFVTKAKEETKRPFRVEEKTHGFEEARIISSHKTEQEALRETARLRRRTT